MSATNGSWRIHVAEAMFFTRGDREEESHGEEKEEELEILNWLPNRDVYLRPFSHSEISFLRYRTAPTRQIIGIHAFCQLKRFLERMIEIGLHNLALHAPS